ncbi:hypothetical protein L228DRAFT_285445 [Xylona heveae TC161]|uniref:CWH43-like N-terminal domain-containing protein n=1 Tax=Xylona heveae (strain CBS 132557 / TC161) TaxID=1328760 RepID=A0A165A7M6_XYLHT|nr:hypothetical protein L228DRAFT_285445 [Xylona heveae TC161]KZF20069.1 hypothetical protein L228DRAFT_285445 [Xylona heveae TC161]
MIVIQLRYLRLFPFIAGTAWIGTLLTLLIYWLAHDRPRYPGQTNPYVAFISDIGASSLKPLFITGAAFTAVSVIGTAFSVSFVRHDRKIYGVGDISPSLHNKVLSALSVLFAIGAGICYVLLAVYDSHRHTTVHRRYLSASLIQTALSSICIAIGYVAPARKTSKYRSLRQWCRLSNALVVIECCLGVPFFVLQWISYYRVAGILEWIMGFVFGLYLWAFVGFLALPDETYAHARLEETAPLLR